MRQALCLYGMAPEESRYKDMINLFYSYDSWKRNLLLDESVDVFLHCWSPIYQKKIIENFNPKSFIFENFIILDNGIKSCALSMKKSVDVMNNYSSQNNIEYEIVMLCRFDVIWTTPINLKSLDSAKFYVSYWGQTDIDKNCTWEKLKIDGYYGTHDIFFIGNQENITLFSNFYNNYEKCLINKIPNNPHTLKRFYLEYSGLINIIDFIYIVGKDLEIEGKCWIPGTPGNEFILNPIVKNNTQKEV